MSLSNFLPLVGVHDYTFSATDNAGNTTPPLSCTIIYNTTAISLGGSNAKYYDKSSDNAEKILYALIPINADSLTFSFSKNTDNTYSKTGSSSCYAPPQSVDVTSLKCSGTEFFNSTKNYTFTADSSGKYTAEIPFTPNGVPIADGCAFLPDGPCTLSYKLYDASGLYSTGAISFSIHRSKPAPVNLSMFGRKYGDSNAWSHTENEPWTLPADKVTSVLAGDTLTIGYTDSALAPALLPNLTNYHIEISDPSNTSHPSTELDQGNNYTFIWGAEKSRLLTVQVKNETGNPSVSKTIRIFKPQWGSGPFQPPQRQNSSSGALSGVLWQNLSIGNGTRGLEWGIGTDSSCITNTTSEAQGSAGITLPASDSLKAGATVYYKPFVDISSETGAVASDFTQQIKIEGVIAPSYTVPYSTLAQPTFEISWVAASGSFDTTGFPLSTADGNNISYQFELGIDDGHGGFDTSSSYEKQLIASSGGIPPTYDYSLWKLCKMDPESSSLSELKGALQSKKIRLTIDEWIGIKPTTFANPTIPNTSAQLSKGNISWDVEAPQITLSGMMASPIAATNSKTVSGTVTEAGGSGQKNVQITWEKIGNAQIHGEQTVTCDSAGKFDLLLSVTDGQYSIQLKAWDNAGNQAILPACIKVFDTTAPALVANSFHFTTTETDTEGNTYAGPDGSVTASIEVNEIGGVGLAGASYRWVDGQGAAGEWTPAAVAPVPGAIFDVFHTDIDTYTLSMSGAQDGVRKLQIRLIDKAGNTSEWPAAGGGTWGVAYKAAGPVVSLSVGGMRSCTGRYWVKQASDLAASYALADANSTNLVQGARWNIQLVNQDGSLPENADEWSSWGTSFEAVRNRISEDGQSYRVQLQVRNANEVVGTVLSSPVFTKDGVGPQDVTASIVGGVTGFIVGQGIQPYTQATDPYGPVEWTWSYQNVGGTGAVVSQDYRPGSEIVIPTAGTFSIVFLATSGSGITVSASPIMVSIAGIGLFVNDQHFNAGKGTIAARWDYAGGSPDGYEHRWIRLGDGVVLRDWSEVQKSTSATLDLDFAAQSTGVHLSDGDVVAIEVKAFDADGSILADVTSTGSVVDTTPPVVTLFSVPSFVAPNDVWLSFAGEDPQSGTTGGSVLVKRSALQSDGSWSWMLVRQENFASVQTNGQRLDVDLSGTEGVGTGDRIVVEVSVEDGAGLTTTQESGIMIVDGTAPPTPLVIPMADAVRYKPSGVAGDPLGIRYQKLSFNWTFTPPDPESGTVEYYWKAYTNAGELAENAWTKVIGQTSVSNLDFSLSKYGTSAGAYSDGTVLFFAVKTVNGVGLESVGYSSGVMLDSKAPWVNTIVAVSQGASGKAPIEGHVQLSTLGVPPSVLAQFNSGDFESGLKSFEVQVGTWNPGTGFIARGDSVGSSGLTNGALLYSDPLKLGSGTETAQAGSIWMIKGHAIDNADNQSVAYSAAFKVEGDFPTITALQGNLTENSVSFSWQVDHDSDFIQGYQLRIGDGETITLTQKLWSGSWKELGYHEGDVFQVTVTPVTFLGMGGSKTASLTISTAVPILAAFDYSRYFSNHFNVESVRYSIASGGIQQVQWRLKDAQTGQILQDWTADYSGLAIRSWKDPYTALISEANKIPIDGQTLCLDIKAQSRTGVWSVTTPSETILVDETPATGITISRGGAHSNASGNTGTIDGWTLTGQDNQSGILVYQTVLSSNPASVDWNGASTVSIADNQPAFSWNASGIGITGATEQKSYYAFIRIQNGTEDWGPAVASTAVDVNWTPPAIGFVYSNTVFAARDSSGNKVSNEPAETVTLTSGKEGTTFALSVNGVLQSPPPATIDGKPQASQDVGIKSHAIVTVSETGTAALSVTGTDLYGNQTTVVDSLRFNIAPAVYLSSGGTTVTTTPGAVLTLEQLVLVTDDSRDYPLSYSWNLGGGTPVGFSGQQTETKSITVWPAGGTLSAYFQNGRNQVTSYTLMLTVTDAWGKTRVESIPVEVHNTTAGKLFTNEYWTGAVTLTGIVEIPFGLELTLDSVDGTVLAPFGEDGIMEGGILVDSGGSLKVANSGVRSIFNAPDSTLLWRGITVAGLAGGSGLEVDRAERGLVLLPTGTVNLSQTVLSDDLIGIHLLGGTLKLASAAFANNVEYGVKEDGAGVYTLLGNVFSNNGVNYYRLGISQITIEELNALPGNSGNR